MELIKAHEDSRRAIHVIKDLLPYGKEFSIIHLNKGKAIGGCYHNQDEYFTVISGVVRVVNGIDEDVLTAGQGGTFIAGTPHAFIGLMDSIVAEWGITTEEKQQDVKDPEMRDRLNKLNDSTV